MGQDSPRDGSEPGRPFQFRLRGLLIAVGVVSIPVALVAWIVNEPERERQRGCRIAAEEWANGEAGLFIFDDAAHRCKLSSGRYVMYWYDRDTGLPVSYPSWPIRQELAEGYNQTIQVFLNTKGTPSWALKGFHVDDHDLLVAMDSEQLVEIAEYPYDVTPSIVLLTNGTVTRPWGSVTCDEFDAFVWATAHHPGYHYLGAQGGKKAFVGQLEGHPHIYFVRVHGIDSKGVLQPMKLFVFFRDGQLLCEVCCSEVAPAWPPDPRRTKYWPDGL